MLVVAVLVAVGLGVRYFLAARGATGTVTGGGGATAGSVPMEPEEDRIDPDAPNDWEETRHPFLGYPPEPAPRDEIVIRFPKARASFPFDDVITVAEAEVTLGDDALPFAGPAHRVRVKAFRIDRYEVTNEQYRRFIKATGHRQPELADDFAQDFSWRDGSFPTGTGDRPVVLVSQADARAYCAWAGKRLPTESEWERVARSKGSRRYPWGDTWDGRKAHTAERLSGPLTSLDAWKAFQAQSEADVSALPFQVGSYPEDVSEDGVYDLHGNVAEWTDSPFAPHPGGDSKASPLFGDENIVVVKGVSFASRDYAAPAAARWPYQRNTFLDHVGFRCAGDAR